MHITTCYFYVKTAVISVDIAIYITEIFSFFNYIKTFVSCDMNIYHDMTSHTIVWENSQWEIFMRKKFVVKYFRLSRLLQTIMNCSIYLWLKNFVCLILLHLASNKNFIMPNFSQTTVHYLHANHISIIKKKQVSM